MEAVVFRPRAGPRRAGEGARLGLRTGCDRPRTLAEIGQFHLVKAGASLGDALVADVEDDLRAVVVEREGRIVGLVPPRSGLWRDTRIHPDALIDRFVEPQPVVCRDTDLLSLALARLKRHGAGAAIVFNGPRRPRARNVVGIITKRAIADAVIHDFDE